MLTDLSINRNDSPTYAQRAKGKILQYLSANAREELNKKYQSEVKATDFTIISSHCAGGTIYHDMGIPFLTPTVNLAIDGDDFCTFCENLEYFLSLELKPYRTDSVDYPVGRLGGDVEIRFIHYNSDRQQVGIMTATADLSGRRVYEKYSNIPELINSLYE